MIEITGKYNSAKIFTDVVDSASTAQVLELCNQEFTAGSRIRMMPDIHAGAGCTIGTTMTITDKIVPNLVGVDIGCGMETLRLRETHLELQKLDKLIYEKIPSGFDIRKKPHRYADNIDLSRLHCADHVDLDRATLNERIWQSDEYIDDGALSVAVGRLRKKLGGDCIRTVYGLGYIWKGAAK